MNHKSSSAECAVLWTCEREDRKVSRNLGERRRGRLRRGERRLLHNGRGALAGDGLYPRPDALNTRVLDSKQVGVWALGAGGCAAKFADAQWAGIWYNTRMKGY